MENEINVEVIANVGDNVIANKSYDFIDKVVIEAGETWTVNEKRDLFIKIKRNEDSLWIDDLTFTRIFEGAK